MKEIKYKVGDQVNYRSANGPILCRVTEHLPGYFDNGSTDGWKIVKVDGSGWAGKSSNNCSAKWLTPVTLKTLKRSDIINLIMLGQSDGLINGTGSTQQQQRAIKIFEEYET